MMWSLLTTLVVAVGCGRFAAARDEPCTTSSGEHGNCRAIQQCAPLLQLYQTIRTNPAAKHEVVKTLRNRSSLCPQKDRVPQLCCTGDNVQPPMEDESVQPPVEDKIVQLPMEDQGVQLPSEDDSECGRVATTGNIIGGKDVAIGEHPWIVSIQYSGLARELRHGCGGSLITKRHVLTAAHCVSFLSNPDMKPEQVRLGEVDFDREIDCLDGLRVCADEPETIKISKVIYHPNFENIASLYYPDDIAILVLATDVTFTDFKKPICLATDLTQLPTGSDRTVDTLATIVGWGGVSVARNGSNFNPVLQAALVPIQAAADCEGSLRISSLGKRICAGGGDGGADTCSGDSGGPLMVPKTSRFFQTGITSFGSAVCGQSAAYTRVFDYMDWIRETIADN